MHTSDQLLTSKQAAKALGITREALGYRKRKGYITPARTVAMPHGITQNFWSRESIVAEKERSERSLMELYTQKAEKAGKKTEKARTRTINIPKTVTQITLTFLEE